MDLHKIIRDDQKGKEGGKLFTRSKEKLARVRGLKPPFYKERGKG